MRQFVFSGKKPNLKSIRDRQRSIGRLESDYVLELKSLKCIGASADEYEPGGAFYGKVKLPDHLFEFVLTRIWVQNYDEKAFCIHGYLMDGQQSYGASIECDGDDIIVKLLRQPVPTI